MNVENGGTRESLGGVDESSEVNANQLRIGLVDAANICMRAWYGTTRGKKPNHRLAAVQTVRILSKFARENLLDGIVWVQEGKPVRRIVKSEGEYKAQRPKMTDGPTKDYFDVVWKLLSVLPVICVRHPEHEGDDVIASMAKDFSAKGHHVIVFSADSDFFQLPEPIKIVSPSVKSGRRYAPKEGISQGEDFLMFKSLLGDKTDNIPGVRGIGPKTASKIISEGVDAWRAEAPPEAVEAFDNALSMVRFEDVDPPLQKFQNGSTSWDRLKVVFHEFAPSLASGQWARMRFSWGRALKNFGGVVEAVEPWVVESLGIEDES